MAEHVQTLTINHSGGGSETYTITRETTKGVRTMTVDGATVSVDRTEPEDIRTLLMDGQTITIDTSAEGIRTLTIDGQEVTIDRSDEVEIIRFVEEFGQPSAAFSLRRLSTAYSGPALRIRRASDNVEVDVAFDTTGVVSADSAIANLTESPVQGDTTATTLGEFLTESVNTYVSDYSAGLDGWSTTGSGTLDGNIDGIGGRDDNLRLTSTNADINVGTYHRKNNILEIGQKYNVTFDFYIPSSNAKLDQIDTINIGGQSVDLSSFTALDQWVSVSTTSTIGAAQHFMIIRWEDSSESGDGTGDVAYIRNVSITAVGHNAYVQTWYDQSGHGNNSTQDTLLSQPLIATNGVLETAADNGLPALVMERSNTASRGLNLDSTISTSANLSSFVVGSDRQDTRWLDTTAGRVGTLVGGSWDGVTLTGGANDGEALAQTLNLTNVLFSMTKVGTTGTYHRNGSLRVTGTCGSTISIAKLTAFPSSNMGRNSLQEAIIYTADQSANRSGIESNIADHYGITLP